MTELCAKILEDRPEKLRGLRQEVPPALEAAIERALEKDRARRFPTIAELAAEIAPYGSDGARASASRIARVLKVQLPAPSSPNTWAGGHSVRASAAVPAIPKTPSGLPPVRFARTVGSTQRATTLAPRALRILPTRSASSFTTAS